MLPITTSFIESEWWALKEIWDKGLLYKGFKIVPYCPRCGTPLSSHEVAQGYKDVKERSAIATLQGKGRGCLHPGMDHHPVDPAVQRGALCKSGRDLCKGKRTSDGYSLLYGAGAAVIPFWARATDTMSWRPTTEKIWNIKSMSRYLTVP